MAALMDVDTSNSPTSLPLHTENGGRAVWLLKARNTPSICRWPCQLVRQRHFYRMLGPLNRLYAVYGAGSQVHSHTMASGMPESSFQRVRGAS